MTGQYGDHSEEFKGGEKLCDHFFYPHRTESKIQFSIASMVTKAN